MTKADLSPYIGIPFPAPGGGDPAALNCWDLYRRMMKDLFAIDLPARQAEYTDAADGRHAARVIGRYAHEFIPVAAGSEKFGDAVLVSIGGLPCHIGFVIGQGKMIHAQQGTLSCIQSYRSHPDWRERTKSFHRHPALA